MSKKKDNATLSLEGLKEYFEQTLREEIERAWEEAKIEGVNSPTVSEFCKHLKIRGNEKSKH